MKENESIREQILSVVDNQLKSNEPPETNHTFIRLKQQGYSEQDAKLLIAQCVSVEIYEVITNRKPFNESRFINNLNNLPEESFE
jgi:hypothetical protein